jgi:BirA family transcriptional regulator, biotin operon repressor / biotin---[acetyl-CoA-carboxylase] ligase
MSAASDRLTADELRRGLEGCRIGNELVVVEETESTNDLAWQAAERGVAPGFVAFAEQQTRGRGQYGRRWESKPHLSLCFSVLLQPATMTLRESPQLTSLLAEAVAAGLSETTGTVPRIKPPNDIYIADRKIAGILVEGRTGSDGKYVAVAGIGLNVNHTLDDFSEDIRASAGSLAMTTGKRISRSALAIALLRQLDRFVR